MVTPAAVDGVGHTTACIYTEKECKHYYYLTQIHNSSFTHSSTVVSSDSHIVESVVGDSYLCRDGLHGDW